MTSLNAHGVREDTTRASVSEVDLCQPDHIKRVGASARIVRSCVRPMLVSLSHQERSSATALLCLDLSVQFGKCAQVARERDVATLI